MRILLAEDDARLGALLKNVLEKGRHQVDWVRTGEAALDYAVHSPYDIVILDWRLPGETGIQVCRRLRGADYHGGIIMLTAKDSVEERVAGLNAGADDCLIKPFEMAELIARILSVGRRREIKLKEDIIIIGDLVVNRSAHSVIRGGREIQLTVREFQLLDFLVQNRGQIIPRDVIINRIWGLDSEVSSNNLEAYVRLLRKKIELPGEASLIQNVRGVGYRLEAPLVCHNS